jgi:hypothetical protein
MTHVTGRRALLQSAAAPLGGAMLPGIAGTTSSQAQTAKLCAQQSRLGERAL